MDTIRWAISAQKEDFGNGKKVSSRDNWRRGEASS